MWPASHYQRDRRLTNASRTLLRQLLPWHVMRPRNDMKHQTCDHRPTTSRTPITPTQQHTRAPRIMVSHCVFSLCVYCVDMISAERRASRRRHCCVTTASRACAHLQALSAILPRHHPVDIFIIIIFIVAIILIFVAVPFPLMIEWPFTCSKDLQ